MSAKKTNTAQQQPAKPSWKFADLSSRITENGAQLVFHPPGVILGRDVEAEEHLKTTLQELPSVKKFRAMLAAYDRQATVVNCDRETFRHAEMRAMNADAETIVDDTDQAEAARAVFRDGCNKLITIRSRLQDTFFDAQQEIAQVVSRECNLRYESLSAAREEAKAEALAVILPVFDKWAAAANAISRHTRSVWPNSTTVIGSMPELPAGVEVPELQGA